MPVKWKRSKVYGFMRYEAGGLAIREGTRDVRVKAGWGHPTHLKRERYWRIEDTQNKHKTVGHDEGYLTLRHAKEVAEAFLREHGRGGEA